ncbi:DNA internalization-related competence protein ComEC/Rec2 [Neptuniibacter sp.]|uniref:DNA internalization-related competence protein ComEC/Rec2 n=1 Tax=Neptuniibacter sp. TaxID=1962643 RepID=UPI0026380E0A|nr:DNA internalization-related competence protein ComEC/Rec2 [Neptuniibacter sp.]MCP4596832.1 DNA internalization-related competence protein ComEC/Rec2 [Neptuniibacter sp.]
MRSRMICFVAGVVLATWQPTLIPLHSCISIALLLALFYIKSSLPHRTLICLFGLGFLYTTVWGHWQIEHRLPESQVRTDWIVKGVVEGLPQRAENAQRFYLGVTEIQSVAEEDSPPELRRLRLSWFKAPIEVKSGQQLSVEVRIKPPHGLINPEGFDYERWLFVRGVDATGYVRRFIEVEGEDQLSVHTLREKINIHIQNQHPEVRTKALLSALITGDKQALSQEDWESLRNSGTVHLAVISGLHIGFMAFVGWWLGRVVGFIFRSSIQRTFHYLFSLALAGGYVLVAGAELPAQRAYIMLVALLVSGWRLFYLDHWSRWWTAVTAVLLFSPLAVWEVGFWLSFTAVALLIWLGQWRLNWREGVKLQGWLLLGMLPLYILFFSGVSLIAPVINLVAIPLVSVLVPLEFLNLSLSLIGLDWLVPIVEWLTVIFWWLVDSASSFSWSFIEVSPSSIWVLLLLCVAVFILLMPKGIVPKSLCLFFFLPVLVGVNTEQNEEDQFQAWVYDVGQGLSVLVEVGDYRLLYDVGIAYRSGGNAFERAVQPHLKAKRVDSLQHVILSHDDIDHVGGYQAVKEHYHIEQLITSFPKGESSGYCRKGDHWRVGEVSFKMIAGSVGRDDNDKSCVLLVENRNCRLLLPGDISKEQEARLSIDGKIDWLVAAHHGSKTSTSSKFLQRLRPENVIFSAGYANHFNHPHPDVVQRVKQHSTRIFNTAVDGAIVLKGSSQSGCVTQTIRKDEKRFWRSF